MVETYLESNLFHSLQIWIDIRTLNIQLAILFFLTIYFHFFLGKDCLYSKHWILQQQKQNLHLHTQSRIHIQMKFILVFLRFYESFISPLLNFILFKNISGLDILLNQELQNYFSLKLDKFFFHQHNEFIYEQESHSPM